MPSGQLDLTQQADETEKPTFRGRLFPETWTWVEDRYRPRRDHPSSAYAARMRTKLSGHWGFLHVLLHQVW